MTDLQMTVDRAVAAALEARSRHRWRLVGSLLGLYLVMFVILMALGFGVGSVEITIWVTVVLGGTWVLVRANRRAAPVVTG
ncbi:MAG: hypothetical protein WKF79_03270 [Nocardioides sp.]